MNFHDPKICTILCRMLLCLLFQRGTLAQAQQPSVVDAWKQRKITLSFQSQSLAVVAGELADKTGRSILIEGEPERSTLDLSKTDTVEVLLNEVADAFDYTWRVSKNGVLLFNKRFRSRTETPQIIVPELNESIADMLAAIRSLPFSNFEARNVQDEMIALLHSLSPTQIQALKQGSKLRVGSLSEGQRTLAEQATCVRMFRVIPEAWESLKEQLAALDAGTVQNKSSSVVNPVSHKQETHISLALQPKNSEYHLVSIANQVIIADDANAHKSIKSNVDDKSERTADPLHGTTTLVQAIRAFSQKANISLVVAPSLASRRLMVQFRRATVSQAMNAFAELEDWTWRTSTSNPPTLSRKRPRAGGGIDEVRQAVRDALPADIRRFFIGIPALADKEVVVPTSLAIYATHENAVRVRFKMEDQARIEALKLYSSLPIPLLTQKAIPCASLTPIQREQIALILTLQACKSSAVDFTSIFDAPASYEANPAEAYLMLLQNPRANLGEFLIAGDITATQRGGAFGTRIMLDTLVAPTYKMQKASPMPPQ